MWHLHGNILTSYGIAANNHGELEGNLAQLQKVIWKGQIHTTVSGEAIRWALRYHWQLLGIQVNRRWDEANQNFSWVNPNFDPKTFIDDDVLGFLHLEGAKLDNSDQAQGGKKKPLKGTKTQRRGPLGISRAVSITPFSGDNVFNSKSGLKDRNSLYQTEVHSTSYQFGFSLTPEDLEDKSRISTVLEGLSNLNRVAGNHGRFLYDFSPVSIILRWTHDFAPRILYSFDEDEQHNTISLSTLIQKISSGDIDPAELWLGGSFESSLAEYGVHLFPGIKAAVEAVNAKIAEDLHL